MCLHPVSSSARPAGLTGLQAAIRGSRAHGPVAATYRARGFNKLSSGQFYVLFLCVASMVQLWLRYQRS